MKIIEYGKMNRDVILLLHGGGLSWWNYRDVAEHLQDQYHIILPILDGHSESDKDFTSIQNQAEEIIEYIDRMYNGSVLLIGGLSLGGQILVEILSCRSDICRFAIIESALVMPMKMTHGLVKPMMDMSYGLIKQKWFSKLQFKALKIKSELYDMYYKDTCGITKENMIAFLIANSSYQVDKRICGIHAKVYIFVGEKEQSIMIRSAKRLHQMILGSVLEIKEGLDHGEYSINHPAEYAQNIRWIIENGMK